MRSLKNLCPLLICAVFLLMSRQLAAQSVSFQKVFSAVGRDYGYDVAVLPDGYIVAGETTLADGSNVDAVLIRTDLNGARIWQKSFGGAAYDQFRSVLPANDGGFIAWGATTDPLTSFVSAWLVKVDDNGTLLWEKTMGGDMMDILPRGDLLPLPDGYIGSSLYLNYTVFKAESGITRFDNAGNIVWNVGGKTNAQDFSTNFIVHSTQAGILAGCGESNDPAGFLRLKAGSGIVGDFIQYGEAFQVNFTDVCTTPDGNFLLCGNMPTSPGNQEFNNALLHKVTPDGDVLWTKSYNHPDWSTHIPRLEPTADGHFIMTVQNNAAKALQAKVDQDGLVLWSKTYGNSISSNLSQARSTADGGYVFTGYAGSTGIGIADILLVKTDSTGHTSGCEDSPAELIVQPTTLALSQNPTDYLSSAIEYDTIQHHLATFDAILQSGDICDQGSVASPEPAAAPLSICPNPAHDFLTIDLSQMDAGQKGHYQIIDASGRMMAQGSISSTDKSILDIHQLPAGAYRLQLASTNGQLFQGLFIKI